MSLIGTVLVERSMLLLLKNLTIEGQKNSVATNCCCGSDIDRRGHGCWVRVQYGIEVGTMAPCVAPSSSTSALLSFKKLTIEGQKTQSLPLLQPYYRFYAQLKVAKVRPK